MEAYIPQMLADRRYLHAHPELSFQEFATARYVQEELRRLRHLSACLQPTETSIIAVFKTGRPGKKIGLRADMDALPIEEQTGLPFASQIPGIMHACGHDAHTAMLLAACRWIDDHIATLSGDIYCIFQHAEELPPGGAQALVDSDFLAGLVFIYGQHVTPNLPVGQVDLKIGSVTTNTDYFQIDLHGPGGHTARPDQGVNLLSVASHLIQSIHQIPSQALHPQEMAAVTCSFIQSGDAHSLNVMGQSLTLSGMIRTFERSLTEKVQERIERYVEHACSLQDIHWQVSFEQGARAVLNDAALSQEIRQHVQTWLGENLLMKPPAMVGEDFSAYQQICPTSFALIGVRKSSAAEEVAPLHSPYFDLDEAGMEFGLKMLVSVLELSK